MNRYRAPLLAFAFFASAAHSQTQRGDFEFGIGAGQVKLTTDLGDDEPEFSASAVGYRITAGYRFPQYVSAELAYIGGNEVSETFSGYTVGATPSAVQASLVSRLPLKGSVELYARAGWNWWEGTERLTDPDNNLLAWSKAKGNDFGWGLGIGGIVEGALVRLEYEQTKMRYSMLHFPSLSVVWLF